MNENLIICDGEFNTFASEISTIGKIAESRYNMLIKQLSRVASEGIKEGNVHDNLVSLIETMQALSMQFEFFTNAMNSDIISYLNEVEIRDFSFYEGGRVDGWN